MQKIVLLMGWQKRSEQSRMCTETGSSLQSLVYRRACNSMESKSELLKSI